MFHYFNSSKQNGFTVVELLVTIGIMMVITSTIVFNQSTYTDGVALSSSVDNVSLSLFQAQAYGVSVKETETGSDDFSAAYGISFNIDGTVFNKNYIFFVDKEVNNKRYDYIGVWSDCTVGLECLEKNTLLGKNYISSICVVRTSGPEMCSSVARVDISFVRPNTDAIITFFNNGGSIYTLPNTIGAKIYITYPGGPTKSVLVYNTGQISVQ
jgi:type II secretory pathway pseudopilin PulG